MNICRVQSPEMFVLFKLGQILIINVYNISFCGCFVIPNSSIENMFSTEKPPADVEKSYQLTIKVR